MATILMQLYIAGCMYDYDDFPRNSPELRHYICSYYRVSIERNNVDSYLVHKRFIASYFIRLFMNALAFGARKLIKIIRLLLFTPRVSGFGR